MILVDILEKMSKVVQSVKEPRIATTDVSKEKVHSSAMFRGKHIIEHDICTGCTGCEKICPVDAIVMSPLPIKKPKAFPEVNLGICIFCGLCEDVCPTKPQKAIYLSGGEFDMLADGTDESIANYWVKAEIPDGWIEQKKEEEAEKARKKAEAAAKKKAEAEAKAKAEAEAKAQEEAKPSEETKQEGEGQ